ncbi:MAG: hypothetical protein DYG94_13705 [Leptolyngbya sp. PLA3]|nr:MAG: hypothetical protein EDM82_14260 [Cyanobacteria bacterium CYA]MCE7969782.1 hypothetical protein [Leptolyngbya sp. PL-A3]
MVMDFRDYQRLSGRSGNPMDRLAAVLADADARHADNAESLQRATVARGLIFRGFGGWPALFVQYPLASTCAFILLVGILVGMWFVFA